MGDDLVYRRMDKAMADARDIAEERELPPQIAGQMGLLMFQARIQIAFMDTSQPFDFEERGVQ